MAQQKVEKAETAQRPRVVIVGAGFGGLNAAKALRNAPADITLIDKHNHHLFQPLLYQVATAGLSPGDIAHPIRSAVRKQANTEVLMGEVHAIDPEKRLVHIEDRAIHFDYLVVATGAAYNYFGHDEWKAHAPALKTIQDATTLRRRILLAFETAEMSSNEAERERCMTFVVVGAGPTGVEMAGAIAELSHRALASDFRHINPRSAKVLLVEAAPRVLTAFPEDLGNKAAAELRRLGVDVRLGAMVENVTDEGVTINGELLPASTVIWAAGVAASPAAQWLDAEADKAGRVKVNPDLSIPGHPNIFVIGDTAFLAGKDGKPLPGLAPVAIQQGRYVAGILNRALVGNAERPPFHYRDKGNLATVGRAFAVADFEHLKFSGFLAWLLWIFVHIFYLVDYHNRVLVMIQWFWGYISFHRGARIIQPATDKLPHIPPGK